MTSTSSPAIRAGALSYILKEIGPDELADAVRKAAAGDAVLHPRVAARVVRKMHGARRDEPNVFHELSDRELEVLKLIAEGLNNTEISRRLFISEKTTKSHVSTPSASCISLTGLKPPSTFGDKVSSAATENAALERTARSKRTSWVPPSFNRARNIT